MAPLVSIAGRDRYQDGEGSLQGGVCSCSCRWRTRSVAASIRATLLRYLGELQRVPGRRARPIHQLGAHRRQLGASDHDLRSDYSVGTFVFGADGRLVEERAIRYNDARGKSEAWINTNDVDREFRGIRVPATGEARW